MRIRFVLRSIGIALALASASGCFVGEEMDNASALSKGGTAAKTAPNADGAKPATPKAAAETKTASAKSAAPAGKSWWETARTLGSEESTTDIAHCKLGGRTEFMQRDDCLARGGSPK